MKQFAPLCVRESAGRPGQGLHPARVLRSLEGDGPVSAVHDPVDAETRDHVVDVGLQIFGRPPFHVRFGDKARYLAVDIGHFRQGLELVLPRVEDPVPDVRLADMVQDEGDFGALPHEFDRIRQLRVEDADIEGESARGQQPDPFDEFRLQTEVGVLGLQQAADALDQRNPGQGLEIYVNRCAQFERRVGHDPTDPPVLPGKTGHPFRFLNVLAGVTFALHEDHLLHPDLPAGLAVFLQPVPLVQQGNIVQPAVPQVVRVPEMYVGVYNGEVQHGVISIGGV